MSISSQFHLTQHCISNCNQKTVVMGRVPKESTMMPSVCIICGPFFLIQQWSIHRCGLGYCLVLLGFVWVLFLFCLVCGGFFVCFVLLNGACSLTWNILPAYEILWNSLTQFPVKTSLEIQELTLQKKLPGMTRHKSCKWNVVFVWSFFKVDCWSPLRSLLQMISRE